MFYFLSKTVDFLLLPICWITILLFAAFLAKAKYKNKLLGAAFGLLLLTTNGWVVSGLMRAWEMPLQSIASQPVYDVGVLLTGLTNNVSFPKDRIHTNKGADRVLHTAELYHAGKLKKILITGAYIDISGKYISSEARDLKQILNRLGVPDSVIILEEQSRNTRESAVNCAPILKRDFKGGKIVLITSAFHMRRSLACFAKVGIETAAFPTDTYLNGQQASFTRLVLPDARYFFVAQILSREASGYLIYKLLGYA